MKFVFAGTVPWWVLLPLFVAVAALTLWLYRRHRLPPPWHVWLPVARLVALALLFVCLLQPVLVREQTLTHRGQIAVVLDDSGSMGLTDRYLLSRQIEIAWRLEFFPPARRSLALREAAAAWPPVVEALAKADAAAAAVQASLDRRQPWSEATERALGELADQCAELGRDLARRRERLRAAVADATYLAPGKAAARLSLARYDGLPGWDLADLAKTKAFPDQSSQQQLLDRAEIPRNRGDQYGGLVRGYLLPPATGDYVFFLCADDAGELFLSTDETPAKKRSLAKVPDFCTYGQWDKHPSQQSAPVALQAGKSYYLEATFKENAGDDHLIIGWRRPDGTDQRPIPGEFLAPFTASRDTNRFDREYEAWSAAVAKHADALATLATAARELGAGKLKDTQAALALADRARRALAAARPAGEPLPALQDLADERLALAGLREVDDALARLNGLSRLDLARLILTAPPVRLVAGLAERGDVSLFTTREAAEPVPPAEWAGVSATAPATRVGSTLQAVLRRYEKQPLAAVVLLSDGANNAGRPLAAVRQLLDDRELPLFALGLGAPTPPPDVAIARVIAPGASFVDDRLSVSVLLKRSGYQDRPIKVTVSADGAVRREITVPPGAEPTTLVDLSFEEKQGGQRDYQVEVEAFPGEAFAHNNRQTFTSTILQDRIRALLLDEFPRWESRYANMMLQRDRRISLRTIFIASTREQTLPGGKDGYPTSRQELFGYHIVILGDVNPRHFTREQLADLRAFVVERGGSLITMAGEHYMPMHYEGTPVADLIPLRRLASGRGLAGAGGGAPGTGRYPVYRLQASEVSRYDDVLQIAADPELAAQLWAGLPGMNWVQPDLPVSPAGELLVSGSDSRAAGSAAERAAPILVKANAGLGRVLYLGSDSFWRWRDRARWTYHHRFWGQILLWATTGRTTGSDRHVKLMADRPAYAPDETIAIKARLLDDDGNPIANADAALAVRAENGELVKHVPLAYLEGSGGEYRVRLNDLPKGRYRAVPEVAELATATVTAELNFEVRDLPTSEFIDLALDETQLKTLSERYLPFEQAAAIVAQVPRLETREQHRQDTELWDSFALLVLVAALLAFEWQMRKRLKLV